MDFFLHGIPILPIICNSEYKEAQCNMCYWVLAHSEPVFYSREKFLIQKWPQFFIVLYWSALKNPMLLTEIFHIENWLLWPPRWWLSTKNSFYRLRLYVFNDKLNKKVLCFVIFSFRNHLWEACEKQIWHNRLWLYLSD